MKHSHLVPSLLILAAALPHPALAAPSATDRQSFQLGFALEYTELTGAAYVGRVAKLKFVTEEEEAHAEAQLSGESEAVRRHERSGVLQTLAAARSLGGAHSVETWLTHRAGVLALPPKPAEEATAADSANAKQVLATVDEISDFTAETRDQLPNLVTIVKLHGGESGLWSFKAGQMMAEIGEGGVTDARVPAPGLVKELLDTAPAGADEALKGKLRALLPGQPPGKLSAGTGNLSSLLPDAPARSDSAAEARNAFLQAYGFTDLPDKLDKS
jgi:hypothetical protein